MKIFVGWPYDAKWVETYALPLLKSYESYGLDIDTGKEIEGEKLQETVKKKIEAADAAIFFTTRRADNGNGTWETSDWVVNEIMHANSHNKEFIYELREEGVEYANKIHDERQHFHFPSQDWMLCLVQLAKVINRWRGLSFRVKLTPRQNLSQEFLESIWGRLRRENYDCKVSIRQGGIVIYGPRPTKVRREGENIVTYTGDIPAYALSPGAVLEVDLEMGGDAWSASRESFTTLEVVIDKL